MEENIQNVEKINPLPFDLIGKYHARVINTGGYITLTIYESNKYIIDYQDYDVMGSAFGHIVLENNEYYILPLKKDPYFESRTKIQYGIDNIKIFDKYNRSISLKKDRIIDLDIIDTTFTHELIKSKHAYYLSNNFKKIDLGNMYDMQISNGRITVCFYYNNELKISRQYGYLHITQRSNNLIIGQIISDSFNFIQPNDGIATIKIYEEEIKIIIPLNDEGEQDLRKTNSNFTNEIESPIYYVIEF